MFDTNKLGQTSSAILMTADVGTSRFCAPELLQGVMSRHKDAMYNVKVDVYSFGILLYCMCVGQCDPYPTIDFNSEVEEKVVDGARPDLHQLTDDTPRALLQLMKDCWDAEPVNRPPMSQVTQRLQEIHISLAAAARYIIMNHV